MVPPACGNCSRRCSSTVRFVDFLRTTVLLSAGVATALATVTVLASAGSSDKSLILIAVGWWVIAVAVGLRLGRRAPAHPPIAPLPASPNSRLAPPQHHPSPI